MPAPHLIRLLTREDGPSYQQLRLESLQRNPEAFLSTYKSESALHESAFADHLDWAYHPPNFGYFGLFSHEVLVAYVQLSQNFLEKQSHTVQVYNLYVGAKFRRQGYASRLMEYILDHLGQLDHIERAYLSCTGRNIAAYTLYKKLGFRRFAVRSKAIKWQDLYDDEIEMVKLLREVVKR